MNDLAPCPFCGNEFPTITQSNSSAGCWRIGCPQCDIYFLLGAGEKGRIKDRIVSAWNRRAVCEEIAQSGLKQEVTDEQ